MLKKDCLWNKFGIVFYLHQFVESLLLPLLYERSHHLYLLSLGHVQRMVELVLGYEV